MDKEDKGGMQMKPKKWLVYILIILCALLFTMIETKAQDLREEDSQQEAIKNQVIDTSIGLLDWQEIEKTEAALREALPKTYSFNLREEMNHLLLGQGKYTVTGILNNIGQLLLGELTTFIQFGARFILIVLLCNLLQALSSAFEAKNVIKISFFVCYMTILLSVVQSFKVMIDLAMRMLDQLSQIMLVCVPTLLAFMATTGYVASSGAMAPIIISTLTLMTYIIKVIIMPCIISVIILEVLSAMSEEFKVDKLIALFYKWLRWVLKAILGISVGLLGMYRLVMPGVDMTVKKAVVKFSTAFIPIVGNAVGGAVDFITQGAALVKNTFSAGVILWILAIVSIPLIKILAYSMIYQMAGAVVEPLGDKKMANIATKLGKGSAFIMSAVGIVALFCICSLVICMTMSAQGL